MFYEPEEISPIIKVTVDTQTGEMVVHTIYFDDLFMSKCKFVESIYFWGVEFEPYILS